MNNLSSSHSSFKKQNKQTHTHTNSTTISLPLLWFSLPSASSRWSRLGPGDRHSCHPLYVPPDTPVRDWYLFPNVPSEEETSYCIWVHYVTWYLHCNDSIMLPLWPHEYFNELLSSAILWNFNVLLINYVKKWITASKLQKLYNTWRWISRDSFEVWGWITAIYSDKQNLYTFAELLHSKS